MSHILSFQPNEVSGETQRNGCYYGGMNDQEIGQLSHLADCFTNFGQPAGVAYAATGSEGQENYASYPSDNYQENFIFQQSSMNYQQPGPNYKIAAEQGLPFIDIGYNQSMYGIAPPPNMYEQQQIGGIDFINDGYTYLTDELSKYMTEEQINFVHQKQGGYLTREQLDFVVNEMNRRVAENQNCQMEPPIYDPRKLKMEEYEQAQYRYKAWLEKSKANEKKHREVKQVPLFETLLKEKENRSIFGGFGNIDGMEIFKKANKAEEEAKKSETRGTDNRATRGRGRNRSTGGHSPVDFRIEKAKQTEIKETLIMIDKDEMEKQKQMQTQKKGESPVKIEKVERPKVFLQTEEASQVRPAESANPGELQSGRRAPESVPGPRPVPAPAAFVDPLDTASSRQLANQMPVVSGPMEASARLYRGAQQPQTAPAPAPIPAPIRAPAPSQEPALVQTATPGLGLGASKGQAAMANGPGQKQTAPQAFAAYEDDTFIPLSDEELRRPIFSFGDSPSDSQFLRGMTRFPVLSTEEAAAEESVLYWARLRGRALHGGFLVTVAAAAVYIYIVFHEVFFEATL